MVSRESADAEKRRHKRIPVKVSSWLSPAEKAAAGGRGVLVDISLGGCRLETRFVDHGLKYQPGDAVLVRFPAGDGGIQMSGAIMWIRPVGTLDTVGVQFHKMSFLKSLPLRRVVSSFRRTLLIETGG